MQRDRAKFDRVLTAAARLPEVRKRIAADLAEQGMPLTRATAVAVRLLDGRTGDVPFVRALVPVVAVEGDDPHVVLDAPPGLFDLDS